MRTAWGEGGRLRGNLGAFGVVMLLAHREDDGYDIGKFYLFSAAVKNGYIGLAVLSLLM